MELTALVIGTGSTLLVIVLTAWIKVNVMIAQIKTQILYLEKEIESETIVNSKEFIKINENFKEVFKGLTEIKITLQNKEDRK